MSSTDVKRNIQNRRELFDLLEAQMQTAYTNLQEQQRFEFESNLIKTYIFEVDAPVGVYNDNISLKKFVERIFGLPQATTFRVAEKDEKGFFEITIKHRRNRTLILYLDTVTSPRFWLGFSMSRSSQLDWWLGEIAKTRSEFDFVWLWSSFLEAIQKRGIARGFGLDYDFRKFQDDEEITTYLKMQIWGGPETQRIYHLLRNDNDFRGRVVLSKVRLKEFGNTGGDLFALQDVKYQGKFTTRGTDFSTHLATVNFVRREYEKAIQTIEDTYALRWVESEQGRTVLEGFALHFIPQGFEIPVSQFCERVLDGTLPFRLLGFTDSVNETSAVVEVVDLHTGGELSFEIYPDLLTVYLPENTCGNTVARLHTNLQHYFNTQFIVEADNGDRLFQPPVAESVHWTL